MQTIKKTKEIKKEMADFIHTHSCHLVSDDVLGSDEGW